MLSHIHQKAVKAVGSEVQKQRIERGAARLDGAGGQKRFANEQQILLEPVRA